MSTVEEIEKAIGSLPRGEFWKLTDRLIARREADWDAAEKEIEAGETQPLDAFLDNEKL